MQDVLREGGGGDVHLLSGKGGSSFGPNIKKKPTLVARVGGGG